MTFVQDKSKNNNAHVQTFELRDLQELRKSQYCGFPCPCNAKRHALILCQYAQFFEYTCNVLWLSSCMPGADPGAGKGRGTNRLSCVGAGWGEHILLLVAVF